MIRQRIQLRYRCFLHAVMSSSDPPLDALLLPFAQGMLQWPQGDLAFLHARQGAALHAAPRERLSCEQSFKPAADALQAAGHNVAPSIAGTFDGVLILPPRQREQARATWVRAAALCNEGGWIVAAVANAQGAKSAQADFAALFGMDGHLSKHHCRVFWARRDQARIDAALRDAWAALDDVRYIADGRYAVRPGVFSSGHVDPGSTLLAQHFPDDVHGHVADLGAGWGYLSDRLLSRNPAIELLDCYEADWHALELARANLAVHVAGCRLDYHWHDATAGLSGRYDAMISNPPFHDGQGATTPAIGQRFIAVAAAALRPGGRFCMVANRHLPYESVLAQHFGQVHEIAGDTRFKVIEATAAGKGTATVRARGARR